MDNFLPPNRWYYLNLYPVKGEKLYKEIVPSLLPNSDAANWQKRGTFTSERDDALASRFYFHSVLCRKLYEDCLYELHTEFHLTPNVISQRLMKRTDFLKEMVANDTSTADLRKKYSYYNWTVVRRVEA